ncbi:hypothetical protein [Hymenobacter guriensis]|uniref:Gliding motility protein GldL n=1 Tax=Hymenobacter guriensis TaxID=2793065 RepID=A0ABS0KY99_9BACT|nr:hypothetical protein [Hymenobacter guriensis]MBG8552092.1 hypothetical protein [Hymenobacter guriensis]
MMTKTVLLSVLLFMAGCGFLLVGSLFRVQHWEGGVELSLAGLATQLAAAVWLVVGVVKRYRAKG